MCVPYSLYSVLKGQDRFYESERHRNHEANADTPQRIQEQHTTPLLSLKSYVLLPPRCSYRTVSCSLFLHISFFDRYFQPSSQLLPKVLNSLNEEVDVLCGRDGGVEDRAEEVWEVALRLVVDVHDALLTESAADAKTVS